MKFTKLNSRGIAHHFLLAFAVIGIVGAFAFQQVAGSAQLAPEDKASLSASAGANTTTKSATCTTRPLLGVGNAGPCVKVVQAKVGVTADGKFGPTTKAAVMKYQKAHGLAADGIVGPKTWAVMLGGTVSSRDISKPSPLVYCTYTIGGSAERTVTDAHISAAACKQHNGKVSTTATVIPRVEISGRVSWGYTSSDTKYSTSLRSSDGYICTANTIDNNKLGTVADLYTVAVQQSKDGKWSTIKTSGKMHHDGNRDHKCFNNLVKNQTYRIKFSPAEGRTQADGPYTVWNYNHN